MIVKLGSSISVDRLSQTEKANMWLNLTSWNVPDSQLHLESKTELSVAKAQNYMDGGTPHRKKLHWEVGTPHILS